MGRLIRQLALLFSLVATTPLYAGGAEAVRPLLVPCEANKDDLKKVDQSLKEFIHHSCRDEIEAAIKACMTEPALTDEQKAEMAAPLTDDGIIDPVKRQAQSFALGSKKNSLWSAACLERRKNLEPVCDECKRSFNEALNSTNKQWQERLNEVNAMPPGPEKIAALKDTEVTFNKVSVDLQDQKNATARACGAADTALTNKAQCTSNQANLYDQGLNQSAVQLASLSTNPDDIGRQSSTVGDTAVDGSNPATRKGDAVLGSVAGEKGAGSTAEIAEHAAPHGSLAGRALKFAGPAVAILAPVSHQDPVGTAAGGAELWTTISGAAPSVARAVSGVGVGATILFASTPTSMCATPQTDPVQAYRLGCPLSTVGGAYGNESAIAALGQR